MAPLGGPQDNSEIYTATAKKSSFAATREQRVGSEGNELGGQRRSGSGAAGQRSSGAAFGVVKEMAPEMRCRTGARSGSEYGLRSERTVERGGGALGAGSSLRAAIPRTGTWRWRPLDLRSCPPPVAASKACVQFALGILVTAAQRGRELFW